MSRRASLLLLVGVLAWAPDGSAAPHDRAGELAAPPELESRPRSAFEEALMRDLVCTCGTCDLEPIGSCRCAFAATLRAEMLAELDKHDLSSDDARQRAARAVRATLIARHGPRVIRRDVVDGYFGEVLTGSLAALGGLFYALSRRLRRHEGEEPRVD